MAFIAVYITHPNQEQAKKVCDTLLKERLIACANFLPIESTYWWSGSIEHQDEVVSLVKTRSELWGILQERVEFLHSYDVPCIVKFEVEANQAYEEWIQDSTS